MIDRAYKEDTVHIQTLFKNLYPSHDYQYWMKHEFDPFENYLLKDEGNISALVTAKKHAMQLKGKKIGYTCLSHIYFSLIERSKGTYKTVIDEICHEIEYQDLMVLVRPDDVEMYRQLGFEPLYERFDYKITRDQIPVYPSMGIDKETTVEEMLEVYQKYVRVFDGYMCRDRDYYHKKMEYYNDNNHRIIVYRNNRGECLGYCIFDFSGYPIKVNEIVYLNSVALVKMLSYIMQYKDTVTFSLTTAEKITKAIPTAVYSKGDQIWARITDYSLFNRLYNMDIGSISELKEKCKPFLMNDYY